MTVAVVNEERLQRLLAQAVRVDAEYRGYDIDWEKYILPGKTACGYIELLVYPEFAYATRVR